VCACIAFAASWAACGDDAEHDSARGAAKPCGPGTFSVAEWRTQSASDSDASAERRRRMIRELLRCRILDGRTRAGVRSLLGHPGDDPRADVWTYYIAPGSLNIDAELLVIGFGPDGRVEGAISGEG
jgi:hypothetical protein